LGVCLVGLPVQAKYSGGTGEPNDPYQIATAADLIALGEEPNDYDKHFIMTADIDLDPNLPGGRAFDSAVIAPDINDTSGSFDGPIFGGVFDGNGHRIAHLTVRGKDFVALFGQLDFGAAVKNLRLIDVDIAGLGNYVGGVVAYSCGGTLVNCCSAGTVSGGAYAVGGLIGHDYRGTVTQCYSSGKVSGQSRVGGLLGYNSGGAVTQCYSAGTVSGTGQNVGGLLGLNDEGTVTASFWDTQTSGQATSAGGTGKTTAEMQMQSTFTDAGWDFNDVWVIWDGYDYPRLQWEPGAGLVFVDVPAGTFEMGDHDGVGRPAERPVHAVTLDGFQMSKYETTNAQYAQFLNAAMADGLIQVYLGAVVYASSDNNRTQPYCDVDASIRYCQIEYTQGRFTVRTRDGKSMANHPVVYVGWYGAKAFCDYYGYRLPTEAEWEYAARGGYHNPYYQYPWGSNTIDCSKANYWNGSSSCNPLNLTRYPYTSPVGYYGPQGAYGLCDMSGNVSEWCQDWYGLGYYSVSPAGNPTGPDTGGPRVLRGGSWHISEPFCRVAARSWRSPSSGEQAIGFRVCR